jgi:predicted ester cyclase
VTADDTDLHLFYGRYLEWCNAHEFEQLAEVVREDVHVNGATLGVRAYIAGLRQVVETVPDFHWDLQRLLVDGCWMSARLIDTGTGPDGAPITVHELAMYRVAEGRIAEVWGDLDSSRLVAAPWSISERD